MIDPVGDFIWVRPVNWDAESTMQSIRCHLFTENRVVALGQQGYRSGH